MRHPKMTTRGTRWALVGVAAVFFFLPKRLPCAFPGQDCSEVRGGRICRNGEVEPLGFYALERVLGRDLGFSYSSQRACE